MKISQLMLVLSLLGGGVHADPTAPPPTTQPTDPQVTFSAGLNVQVCDSAGICSVNSQITEVTLALAAVVGDSMHSRGYYTIILPVDGLRYIGIVTVDKWDYLEGPNPQPPGGSTTPVPPFPQSPTYSYTVEILDAHGTSGQMSISLVDSATLPSTTLSGRTTAVGGTQYTPMFSIGPSFVSGTCNDPRNPCPQQPVPPGTAKPKWNVKLGNLR